MERKLQMKMERPFHLKAALPYPFFRGWPGVPEWVRWPSKQTTGKVTIDKTQTNHHAKERIVANEHEQNNINYCNP
jgi:hypothetical protein